MEQRKLPYETATVTMVEMSVKDIILSSVDEDPNQGEWDNA